MSEARHTILNALILARRESRATYRAIATDLGIQPSMTLRFLGPGDLGKRDPSLVATKGRRSVVLSLARYFNLNPADLLSRPFQRDLDQAAWEEEIQARARQAPELRTREWVREQLAQVEKDEEEILQAVKAIIAVAGLTQSRIPGLLGWSRSEDNSRLRVILARNIPLRLSQYCDLLDLVIERRQKESPLFRAIVEATAGRRSDD